MKKAIFYKRLFIVVMIFFVSTFLINVKKVLAEENQIILSEIMYDYPGSDSGQEWIELYNSGTSTINVLIGSGNDTWRFFDSSNHIINLYQGTTTIGSGEYFIIAQDAENFILNYPDTEVSVFDTVMNLKNTSSSISVSFDGGGTYIINELYDSSWGASGNGFSLEKINLNQDSTIENWQESSVDGGTPGKKNSETSNEIVDEEEEIIAEEEQETTNVDTQEDVFIEVDNIAGDTSLGYNNLQWNKIIISEFLPNPVGSDDGEWIELYNESSKDIDLSGFSLQDNSSRIFVFDEDSFANLIIKAKDFFVIGKDKSKISLNNSGGDSVKIYDPEGNLIESIEYSDTAIEGKSYARQKDDFVWTGEISPGTKNIFVENLAPTAVISFKDKKFFVDEKIILSAEESYDPEEGKLEYLWDFGDETSGDEKVENHIFGSPGKYLIKLKVVDNEGLSDEVSLPIEIEDSEKEIGLQQIQKIDFELEDLLISEFLPNPVGSDDAEWIEIYNNSGEKINLLGWQIDDKEGGSRPYRFDEDIFVEPKSFLIVSRAESKITLNNTEDSVRIITPLGEEWQEVVYEKISEGKSLAWDFENKEWFEAEPSPGTENIFFENIQEEHVYSVWETKELNKGDNVLVQGVVIVKNSEGSPSVYLADWDGERIDTENLIEVYSHYKDFPELRQGQLVTVGGEISKIGLLPRIKIKNHDQIQSSDLILEIENLPLLEIADFSEDNYGTFSKIRGIVVKKSGKNVYLAEDIDSESLIRAYFKFSAVDLEIKKEQEVIIEGIILGSNNLPKITVFNPENISISKKVLGEKIENTDEYTTTTNVNEYIDVQKRENNVFLFAFIGLLVLILIFFVNKKFIIKN